MSMPVYERLWAALIAYGAAEPSSSVLRARNPRGRRRSLLGAWRGEGDLRDAGVPVGGIDVAGAARAGLQGGAQKGAGLLLGAEIRGAGLGGEQVGGGEAARAGPLEGAVFNAKAPGGAERSEIRLDVDEGALAGIVGGAAREQHRPGGTGKVDRALAGIDAAPVSHLVEVADGQDGAGAALGERGERRQHRAHLVGPVQVERG